MTLRVQDSGPGIPEEMIDKIIKPYVRGELVEPWWPMLDDGGLGCDLANVLSSCGKSAADVDSYPLYILGLDRPA